MRHYFFHAVIRTSHHEKNNAKRLNNLKSTVRNMKKYIVSTFIILTNLAVFSQTVTLTFSGKDLNNRHVQLDWIVVKNITQTWTDTLYWPDTVLIMQDMTGVPFIESNPELSFSQVSPNPFSGNTTVVLNIPEHGSVKLELWDLAGHLLKEISQADLPKGAHRFRLSLRNEGTFLIYARQNGKTTYQKLVNQTQSSINQIEYDGEYPKNTSSASSKSHKGTTQNPFVAGDLMKYYGQAVVDSIEIISQEITQVQETDQYIPLTFNTILSPFSNYGTPCPSTPILIDYDGNAYNTVQIGNQCWMKENLRTTHYSDGTSVPLQTESTATYYVPYRYYPHNDPSKVPLYGYLYNWNAARRGIPSSAESQMVVQGLCPDGWHLPGNADWQTLMEYVGGIPEYVCNDSSVYIAKSLAAQIDWYYYPIPWQECTVGENISINNATGFSALPAGNTDKHGNYEAFTTQTYFWCSNPPTPPSTHSSNTRIIDTSVGYVITSGTDGRKALSIRCIKD